ncbi:MAG: hypothetical protein ACAH89_14185 [Rariglobus sp.]|nr:hypothetical protein [Rariglobus sp.]
MSDQEDTLETTRARHAFGVAGVFLVVVAALGALLRWQSVWPMAGVNYTHWLHAHSHTAFLGWVFNAFFALALHRFVAEEDVRVFWRLFGLMQVAVVGMLIAYPIQGYGAVSIVFSTLHMVCSVVFAWRLWRRNRATPAARIHLRVALAFMIMSGLGPLTLGPLAALGMRDSPAYLLSLYFYLHCQYNGWFMFFLQALAWQDMPEDRTADARRAAVWLGAGAVLTLVLSALWLHPPGWVYAVAVVGGAAQLIGCFYLLRGLRGFGGKFIGAARGLVGLVVAAFLLKHALQAASAWPALETLVNHRFMVIAFLHLVFLGVVTPSLLAWALRLGWLRDSGWTRAGIGVFFTGAVVSELVLVGAPLGWVCPRLMETLLAATLAMLVGAVAVAANLKRKKRSSV